MVSSAVMPRKKIAINTFGDTGHLATLLQFKKYRMDPRSFLFIAVRSEARFAAFLCGSVDAAPLTPRDIAQIGASRAYAVADMSKEIQLVWNGVAVTNKRALRSYLVDLATQAGVHGPRASAEQLALLFEGAIVTALLEGSAAPARTARAAAQALLRTS